MMDKRWMLFGREAARSVAIGGATSRMNTGFEADQGVLTTVFPVQALANQCVARYNTALTTKRAGTNRPFFLVERFWSSKLSGKVSGGYRVFCFGLTQTSKLAPVDWFTGIELNTWHCSKSLNKS